MGVCHFWLGLSAGRVVGWSLVDGTCSFKILCPAFFFAVTWPALALVRSNCCKMACSQWQKIAKAKVAPTEAELRAALVTAIPDELRCDLWLKHSGAFSASKRGLFASLVNSPERVPGEFAQIELDIGRSGLHEVEQQQALRRVLRAYSSFQKSTGYVQGQNFIAAGLLRALPEEEAFWLLVVVVDKYLPEHFTHAMSGSFVDCRVLAELLADRLPDVSTHLADLGVTVQLLATRWFLSLWSSVLPPPTLMRVYDCLFTLGPSTLLLVALAWCAPLQHRTPSTRLQHAAPSDCARCFSASAAGSPPRLAPPGAALAPCTPWQLLSDASQHPRRHHGRRAQRRCQQQSIA